MHRRAFCRICGCGLCSVLAGCQTFSQDPTYKQTTRWTYSLPQKLDDFPIITSDKSYLTNGSVIALDNDSGTITSSRYSGITDLSKDGHQLFARRNDGQLYALLVNSLTQQWSKSNIIEAPHIGTTNVFAIQQSENTYRLIALDRDTGEIIWELVSASLMRVTGLTENYVITRILHSSNKRKQGVYALNRKTGKKVWFYPLDFHWGPSMILGETVIAGSEHVAGRSPKTVGIDVNTGKQKRSFTGSGPRAYPLLGTEQEVYILTAGIEADTYVLDTSSGDVLWTTTMLPHSIGNKFVYLEQEGNIVAAKRSTGSEQWRFDVQSRSRFFSPAYPEIKVENGHVNVLSGNTVFGLAPKTGDLRWKFVAHGPLSQFWAATTQFILVALDRPSPTLYLIEITIPK
ncbi:MAG: PQQ-binding-like beta-propeller repeat protein [Halobacteriaceae archaeon]